MKDKKNTAHGWLGIGAQKESTPDDKPSQDIEDENIVIEENKLENNSNNKESGKSLVTIFWIGALAITIVVVTIIVIILMEKNVQKLSLNMNNDKTNRIDNEVQKKPVSENKLREQTFKEKQSNQTTSSPKELALSDVSKKEGRTKKPKNAGKRVGENNKTTPTTKREIDIKVKDDRYKSKVHANKNTDENDKIKDRKIKREKQIIESKEFINDNGMKFIKIAPGGFIMGSTTNEPGRNSDETQHQVSLKEAYFIQTTEVTQNQWLSIMGSNPSKFIDCGKNCPVENVSWNDVKEFITRLNEKQATIRYRLPSEAEWEYACRAGKITSFPSGDCLSTEQANYNGNYHLSGCQKGENRNMTTPVSSFKPNQWGLFDMSGNVWEWCSDWYAKYPIGKDIIDPKGPPDGAYKVCRGGSWKHEDRKARSASRHRHSPTYKSPTLGFRLVIEH